MSETASPAPARGGSSDLVIIGAVALAIVGAIYLFSGGERTSRLDRAATGFAGMVQWLRAQEVETLVFRGEGVLSEERAGLRILPLYDVDLETDRIRPRNNLEVVLQISETDMPRDVFERKVADLPSLVILPKWRTGMRALGFAHKDLLIPGPAITHLLGQIGLPRSRIVHEESGLTRYDYELDGSDHEISLFHGQMVSGTDCTPILGTRRAMLFGRCASAEGDTYYLLSDPDLMDNHGLRLAGNAGLAEAIIERHRGEGPAVFDLTTRVYTYRRIDRREARERSWEEIGRMFAYPFSVLWIAFACVSLLVLWRGVTRYGPLARVYDDEPGASKEVSIDAKARLLRLSDHDAQLVNSHITARLQALAAELLGAHRPAGVDTLTLLTRLVARRSPALADELTAASTRVADHTPIAELVRQLDRFETAYDRISHEFGRIAGAR